MRIVVFGAGSLGSALGAVLSKKNDVALVGRRSHVSAIRRGGLKVIGDLDFSVELEARESVAGLDHADLIIITTKAFDTPSAVESCRRWAGKDAMVLTLQNGLGNLEALRAWKGRMAFGGTTTMGANLLGPAEVRLSGLGRTVIGSDLDPEGAREIARAFSSCGLRTQMKTDITGEIWAKAVVSACINPLTAILRVPNGTLLKSDAIRGLTADLCEECESVAKSSGVKLPCSSMIRRVRGVARSTRENRSSMLQDVERGRRTEIEQINGAFVRLGLANGVRTPLNLTMLAMVDALGKG